MLNSSRIYYMCSYVPLEILSAFDLEPVRTLWGPVKEKDNERLLHRNMCGYVKNIINGSQQGNRNMIFTDCCDCAVRLRDVWNCFFGTVKFFV